FRDPELRLMAALVAVVSAALFLRHWVAVLSLEETEFDLSDRGVAGRPAPGPIDVFLTPDRGAYRPGETIHATVLVRDPQARAIAGLPLTVRLLRPDGVEHARVLASETGAGGFVVALPLAGGVPRGVWRIAAYADPEAPPLATQTVLVEDFLPERVDVALTLPDGLVAPFAAPPLEVDARYLFGAPAAGLTLTGDVAVEPTETLPGWAGYAFGRHDQRVDAQRFPFAADLRTDADGRLTTRLPLDRLDLDARPYALTVTATLIDGASRPVERTLARTLRPIAPVVGIRPGFDGPLPENAEASFDLVLVDPDGTATAGAVRWQVDRVETRYQWYAVDGRWYWEPVTERQRVGEGVVLVADGPARVTVPVEWGRYELRATYEGPSWVASASTTFAAGWTAVDATRETPDRLEVSLDAERYTPGDTARLRLVPEEPGMALVTVLTDRVVDVRLVAVDGPTTVELPVTADWGASAYVTASLIRPSDGPEHVPARTLGLAHAAVEPGERALQATLVAPTETRSGTPLDVALEVAGAPDGTAYATVAAVDLGVLNLTGFEAPDPTGHYFGQRQLGVAIRDLYGRLIDARAGAMGEVRSGGAADASEEAAGPAPAEAIVALFSGPVEVTGGRAEVAFDLPPFAGTLRLMAVVWTDAAVGDAVADVLVRDPVVVQASLPRFLTPGDESRLRIELTHVTGATGAMALSVDGHGVGDVPASVDLDDGGRAVVDVPLRPTDLGDHTYRVTLTTPDGEFMMRELRLTVQHTDPVTARSERFELAPGESFELGTDAVAGFRAGTERATLAAGAGAALDVPGLVLRLTGYPYGCTEQIASSLQPLLLAPDAVARLGLASGADARAWLQDGVDRMLTRQGRDGSFGLWSAGGWDLWLSAYATDVLLRAEAAGASVPAPALRMALDHLRNQVAQAGTMQDGAAGYAYALYVLARAGEAAIGDLRYYADTLQDAFDTPMAAAQLGAALAAYGERTRADAMFDQALVLARAGTDEGGWRADYGTDQRDRAAILALAIEAGSGVVDRAALAAQVAAGGPVDRLSTQEAAWQLHAAAALTAEASGLVLDGEPVAGDALLRYDGTPRVLRNDGDAPVAVTLTTFGVPEVAPPAGGTAYAITRTHYTPEGEPTDLGDVRIGDRLVVVLEVRPDRGVPGGRLMVDDPLPAGFEIDNANLLRAGDVRALDGLGVHGAAESFEARADRFLAAVDWRSDEPLVLAYFVRAVSPGTFHYAAPLVEDLYRPANRAIGETGRLTIRP
ncbi:MAG: MG2 domain-containing protein, partial [Trueperaceae bacterium]|nr:MG2 domain-containing protein [Trueperaceae bacterium]